MKIVVFSQIGVLTIKDFGFDEAWGKILSSSGVPQPVRVWLGMPKIPSTYSKCVFYLYSDQESARAGINEGGTGFLIGVPSKLAGGHYLFAVTNWHVAVRGGFSVIRMNKLNGETEIIDLGPDQWLFTPHDYDICITPIEADEKVHDISFVPVNLFVDENYIKKFDVGPGDDVFMSGRFIDSDGGQTNTPALRFGNISMMPQLMRQDNNVDRKSYYIDLHSRSGFSGSPVFVYRTIGQDLSVLERPLPANGNIVGLLGIHWGQAPEEWAIDSRGIVERSRKSQKLFTVILKRVLRRFTRKQDTSTATIGYVKGWSGMTCVAPAYEIKKLLEIPQIAARLTKLEAEVRQKLRDVPNPE